MSWPDDDDDATDGLSGTGGLTKWNPNDTGRFECENVKRDPCATLYHEMSHLVDYEKGTNRRDNCFYKNANGQRVDSGIAAGEVKATREENKYRLAQEPPLPQRTCYDIGKPLPPDGAECLEKEKPPPDAPSGGCGSGCAIGAGDPHLKTFDGRRYDFQAVGEFVLTRASGGGLEVQGRTTAPRGLRTVSVFSALAMNVTGDRVGLYRLPGGLRIHVGEEATKVPIGTRKLAKGGAIEVFGRGLAEVRWPDGSVLRVKVVGSASIRLSLHLAETRRGKVEGLFGNFDGKSDSDLVVQGGASIGEKPSFETLHRSFGESWRVTQNQSLFNYAPGRTTETFTDRTFPDKEVSARDLPNRTPAEAICRQAGGSEPITLEGCILDVGLAGELAFAADAVTTQQLVGVAATKRSDKGDSSRKVPRSSCFGEGNACGNGDICSWNGPDTGYCCKAPWKGTKACFSDRECSGGICGLGAGNRFYCTQPDVQPCR